MATSIMGYPLTVYYCPSCGSDDIKARDNWQQDGFVKCNQCKATCYIIEGEDEED